MFKISFNYLFRAVILLSVAFFLLECRSQPSQSPKSQASPPQNFAEFLALDLNSLYQNLNSKEGNSWQAVNQEKRQTYQKYITSRPTSTTEKRNKIYLQTFGEFTNKEKEIIEITAEYLEVLYHLEVETLATQSLNSIPDHAQRINKHTKENQILSTHFLNKVLLPQLPDSAAVYIGFTASDLYPSESWNYVFGQANLRRRTGIWSIYRFGKPDLDEKSFNLTLSRTIKTASHEIGHIFSIRHCVDYECAMAGSNNLRDLDRHPIHFCPFCTAKICTNLTIDLAEHYKNLELFWKKKGFDQYAEFYSQNYQIITSKKEKYSGLQGFTELDSALLKK